jgi:SAM-dependent methyltransferase
VGLRESLWHVDRLGYNAVDFKVLNFRPTAEQPARFDVRTAMRSYELADDWDAVQVKAWRKQPTVDLTSSGGHEARFDGRRIFPIRFLSRHYPIRSQSHGTRKVFTERRPRFSIGERGRGWHVQYDHMTASANFVRNASDLLAFDPAEVRAGLALEYRGLDSLTSELANERREHARAVEEMQSRCAASSAELERLREDVATANRQLDTERARFREDVAAATRLLDSRRDEVAKLQEDIAASAANHAELERRMAASAQVARRLEEQQAFAQNRLREHLAEAERARDEVLALRQSRSWQITAPLRAIYELALRSGPVPAEALPPRLRPVSDQWGVERGVPVDRHYIEQFLREHRGDVRGRVLEVKDPGYARMLDDGQVQQVDVLDVDPMNTNATLTADLAHADNLESAQFDCFILTQTLHIIYDIRAALGHAIRVLRPGGVLLCTVPAISRVNYENGGLQSGDYWRLTHAAVRRLFDEVLPATSTEITTYGNVAVCSAFLYGLAATEIPPEDLAFSDPWFPLIHCIRAVKG